MIVLSAVLVIVALVLLILGLLVSSGLTLIYASIAVSVISGVLLFIGVRQRRDEVPTDPGTGSDGPQSAAPAAAHEPVAAESTTVMPAPAAESSVGSGRGDSPAEPVAESPEDEQVESPPGAADSVDVQTAAPDHEVAGEAAAGGEVAADTVYVVPGRPRYHRADCRFLAGRDVETRSRTAAENEGFTPCTTCTP